jgi:hypothetical protein
MLYSNRIFPVIVIIWLVFLDSSRATADEVLVISCDPPYGFRYVPVLFGRDRLFEINGSSQKELCSDQDSVLTYENGRLICRYATVATKAIMRSAVEEYQREVDRNVEAHTCTAYNEVDGTSSISLSCLMSRPSSDFGELDFGILRETDASIVQWYHSYVSKIEIDFHFRTVSSTSHTISTEQRKSQELLLSGVHDGTISSASLHVSESGYDYRGQICE